MLQIKSVCFDLFCLWFPIVCPSHLFVPCFIRLSGARLRSPIGESGNQPSHRHRPLIATKRTRRDRGVEQKEESSSKAIKMNEKYVSKCAPQLKTSWSQCNQLQKKTNTPNKPPKNPTFSSQPSAAASTFFGLVGHERAAPCARRS